MTSWEDVVNQVVIPGDGQAISAANETWNTVFHEILDLKHYLDDGLKDLDFWKGAAGDAYREKVTEIAKSVTAIHDENQSRVNDTLNQASSSMTDAIATIPIPQDLAYEVLNAKTQFKYHASLTGFGHNAFSDFLVKAATSRWSAMVNDMMPDWAQGWLNDLRDWITDKDDKAVAIYNQLNGHYANLTASLPGGGNTANTMDTNPKPIDLGSSGGGAGGGVPGLGSGGFDPSAYNPDTGYTPTGDTGLNPTGSGYDPSVTGLSGAGTGDPTGLGGLGGGGLGGPGTGAMTGVGEGTGLGALKAAGMGNGVSPFGANGVPGFLGGAAGRGGMMGGGHGAGGDGDEHQTWLQEDDDVWGTNSDASPSLLN